MPLTSVSLATSDVASNALDSSLSASQQSQLRRLLEKGLPIAAKPYLELADKIDASEPQVIEQIESWQESGLIKRFGLVVKHRQLGYTANAMVVWNIPNEDVDIVAHKLSMFDEVSLCYRRPRRLPDWPYNLFCMIHGQERSTVLKQIEKITEQLGLAHIQKDVLFSYKAYKQNGARYATSTKAAQKTQKTLNRQDK